MEDKSLPIIPLPGLWFKCNGEPDESTPMGLVYDTMLTTAKIRVEQGSEFSPIVFLVNKKGIYCSDLASMLPPGKTEDEMMARAPEFVRAVSADCKGAALLAIGHVKADKRTEMAAERTVNDERAIIIEIEWSGFGRRVIALPYNRVNGKTHYKEMRVMIPDAISPRARLLGSGLKTFKK